LAGIAGLFLLIMANVWAFAYAVETRCSPQKHRKKRTKDRDLTTKF